MPEIGTCGHATSWQARSAAAARWTPSKQPCWQFVLATLSNNIWQGASAADIDRLLPSPYTALHVHTQPTCLGLFILPTLNFGASEACSGALARGPALSLPRPRRLADVTPAVCTLGADNRAHDFAVQMRQHLQSFLTGSVAALAFGYYRVHQDVWYAAEAVQQRR